MIRKNHLNAKVVSFASSSLDMAELLIFKLPINIVVDVAKTPSCVFVQEILLLNEVLYKHSLIASTRKIRTRTLIIYKFPVHHFLKCRWTRT